MREYTVLAVVSVLLAILLDRRLRTRVLQKVEFWIAACVMIFFKIPSNGYLTGRPIVLYDPDHLMGVRLWTIPIEDFFYGFGLITFTIILWEYFLRRKGAL
jgi:lycopene cyclase domain-containing protein